MVNTFFFFCYNDIPCIVYLTFQFNRLLAFLLAKSANAEQGMLGKWVSAWPIPTLLCLKENGRKRLPLGYYGIVEDHAREEAAKLGFSGRCCDSWAMTKTCYQDVGSELSTSQTLGLNTSARIYLRGSLSSAWSLFNQSRMTFLASVKCVLVASLAGDPGSLPVQLYLRLYEMMQTEENFKFHVVCRRISLKVRLRSFTCLVIYAALNIVFKILQPTGSNEIRIHDTINSPNARHRGQSDSNVQLWELQRKHCVQPKRLALETSGNPAPWYQVTFPEYWEASLAIEAANAKSVKVPIQLLQVSRNFCVFLVLFLFWTCNVKVVGISPPR